VIEVIPIEFADDGAWIYRDAVQLNPRQLSSAQIRDDDLVDVVMWKLLESMC
jgi:hypothetical protein